MECSDIVIYCFEIVADGWIIIIKSLLLHILMLTIFAFRFSSIVMFCKYNILLLFNYLLL